MTLKLEEISFEVEIVDIVKNVVTVKIVDIEKIVDFGDTVGFVEMVGIVEIVKMASFVDLVDCGFGRFCEFCVDCVLFASSATRNSPFIPPTFISDWRFSSTVKFISTTTTMDVSTGDLNGPHMMGTTIIGVTYNGGVVLGADSRTSTGMYVANRASDKITQLTDNVYICRSGSLGQPSTVKVAANLVRLLSYNNKNSLQTGLIVGGWDKYEGGKIYGVPLGGTILELPFTIGGSGSSYLYGFFDQVWKEGMTQDEAEQLVVKAVSLAIARDGASGGVVRTVTINKDGATRKFYPGDALPLWHEELEPKDSLLDILSSATIPEPMVS
ncbi:hypothetical protein BUALT_Bualt11G0075400 [Buddleja alternifolia]|uniref:Proteasome endopeptidase complex n=1 Tax=Buddleja alternifolia TaxID=168488 RepID=A0AAV6X440_9LAMI|nr:hypothetical protein BUALT_Bualt11G0075400 [Buddleja alternifolia]